MKYKYKILELRSQGKSYNEISKILGCDKGTISYHCNPDRKGRVADVRREYNKNNFLVKKLSRFRHNIKNKSRDFQRRAGNGKVEGNSECNFKVIDVLKKIGENPICYLSGESIDLTKTKTYHFDHIIPASRGGLNTLDNLGILCSQVNKMKSDLTIEEFLDYCVKVLTFNGYNVTGRV